MMDPKSDFQERQMREPQGRDGVRGEAPIALEGPQERTSEAMPAPRGEQPSREVLANLSRNRGDNTVRRSPHP